MKLILYLYRLINGFMERLKEDHVGAYASQAALFMIMALFPMLILLLNVLQYTPVTEEFLLDIMMNIMPDSFKNLAGSVIRDVYQSSSGTLLSISIIFTIWSASKGILALIRGFSNITHTKENRNYIVLRLIASVYTVLFVLGIVLTLVLMVFGNSLLGLISRHFPIVYDVADGLISHRILYVPILMTLLFVFMYRLVPNGRRSLISYLPGAVFSSVGWLTFSFFYSYYVDHFSNLSYSYGSLTMIVLLMLWLYICMYIIFIGAEINIYFYMHFRHIKRKIKRKKEKK
ncbi:MAG: YihY/virulence factor BrkB family protein [Lachnospiraceae bacterium]|nr:YihY/virulence factor BrkB family protein [Lachnospiraceae bacterium]